MRLRSVGLLVGLMCAASTDTVQAAITFNVNEVGSDVVITASGTLNLSGLASLGVFSFQPGIDPSVPIIGAGVGGSAAYYTSTLQTSEMFGTGGPVSSNVNAGSPIGFEFSPGSYIALPQNYKSNTFVSGTSTITGASFSSLGLDEGSYDYILRNGDSFRVQIGPVPLPSSAPMFGVAVLALGAVGYGVRRRNVIAA